MTSKQSIKIEMARYIFPLFFLFSYPFFAQVKDDDKKDENVEAAATTDKEKKKSGSTKISGFDGKSWGENYRDIKDYFRSLAQSSQTEDPVEIINDIENREIKIRRRGIIYRYVFYSKKEPDILKKKEKIIEEATDKKKEEKEEPAKFFFVESTFNLLATQDLYKKLNEKYGKRTRNTVNDRNRGAYIWETDDGILVQWIEPYNDKPYTRSLYYISTKIRNEIIADLQQFRFAVELKDIDRVIPKK